jgi:hypothetical protein
MAFESPWATWKWAPIGRLIPWTSATDAFENVCLKTICRGLKKIS